MIAVIQIAVVTWLALSLPANWWAKFWLIVLSAALIIRAHIRTKRANSIQDLAEQYSQDDSQNVVADELKAFYRLRQLPPPQ